MEDSPEPMACKTTEDTSVAALFTNAPTSPFNDFTVAFDACGDPQDGSRFVFLVENSGSWYSKFLTDFSPAELAIAIACAPESFSSEAAYAAAEAISDVRTDGDQEKFSEDETTLFTVTLLEELKDSSPPDFSMVAATAPSATRSMSVPYLVLYVGSDFTGKEATTLSADHDAFQRAPKNPAYFLNLVTGAGNERFKLAPSAAIEADDPHMNFASVSAPKGKGPAKDQVQDGNGIMVRTVGNTVALVMNNMGSGAGSSDRGGPSCPVKRRQMAAKARYQEERRIYTRRKKFHANLVDDENNLMNAALSRERAYGILEHHRKLEVAHQARRSAVNTALHQTRKEIVKWTKLYTEREQFAMDANNQAYTSRMNIRLIVVPPKPACDRSAFSRTDNRLSPVTI